MFHAGRHATDASDYTMPLTAGGPTLAGEVRGYAVAITDATLGTSHEAQWVAGPEGEYNFRSGVSTDKYAWNGYANCRAMHDYVTAHAGEGWEMRHFQAAWSCETYGNRTLDYDGNPTSDYEWQAPLRAPAGTSGWFLPSAAQLYYMATCRDYLDSRFMAAKAASAAELQGYVKGFDTHSDCVYWSSTEDERSWYTDYAYGMSFSEPIYTTSPKSMNYYAFTRPVIVF